MPKKKKSTNTEQHIWKEILVQPEIFSPVIEFPDASDNEIAVIKEAKLLVQQLLHDRVIELVSIHFTPHQKRVLALIQAPERTYNDVAEILSINYTGVSHAIKGIKSKKHEKMHGGYEKKLRKICLKDNQCKEYIDCIQILRNNNAKDALLILSKYDPGPIQDPATGQQYNSWIDYPLI